MTKIALPRRYHYYLTMYSAIIPILFSLLSHNYVSRHCLNSIPPAHLNIWLTLHYLVCLLSHCFPHYYTLSIVLTIISHLFQQHPASASATYDQYYIIPILSHFPLLSHNCLTIISRISTASHKRIINIWPTLHDVVGISTLSHYYTLSHWISHYYGQFP